jgi:hypothetical protein
MHGLAELDHFSKNKIWHQPPLLLVPDLQSHDWLKNLHGPEC